MKFDDYKKYLSPALSKSTDLIMESGKGMYITDVNGDTYLDFVQGIAVNAFGHCHPKIVEAAKNQIDKLITASFNMVNYPTTLELARRLSEKLPGDLNSIFSAMVAQRQMTERLNWRKLIQRDRRSFPSKVRSMEEVLERRPLLLRIRSIENIMNH